MGAGISKLGRSQPPLSVRTDTAVLISAVAETAVRETYTACGINPIFPLSSDGRARVLRGDTSNAYEPPVERPPLVVVG